MFVLDILLDVITERNKLFITNNTADKLYLGQKHILVLLLSFVLTDLDKRYI